MCVCVGGWVCCGPRCSTDTSATVVSATGDAIHSDVARADAPLVVSVVADCSRVSAPRSASFLAVRPPVHCVPIPPPHLPFLPSTHIDFWCRFHTVYGVRDHCGSGWAPVAGPSVSAASTMCMHVFKAWPVSAGVPEVQRVPSAAHDTEQEFVGQGALFTTLTSLALVSSAVVLWRPVVIVAHAAQLPRLPPKKIIGAMSPAFVEDRRKQLSAYLKALVILQPVWQLHCIVAFLDGPLQRLANAVRLVCVYQLVPDAPWTFDALLTVNVRTYVCVFVCSR